MQIAWDGIRPISESMVGQARARWRGGWGARRIPASVRGRTTTTPVRSDAQTPCWNSETVLHLRVERIGPIDSKVAGRTSSRSADGSAASATRAGRRWPLAATLAATLKDLVRCAGGRCGLPTMC